MQRKGKILAVDDDPMNLAVMEELLGDDYAIKSLSNGSGVVETARNFRPDLVLLDIMMPGVNGYEVCQLLRSQPDFKHLKIVLVSAKAMLKERLAGYDAGADDYITKPFDPAELRAKVKVYVRLKSVEEVNEFKTTILTLFHHDTRTPLSAIMGSADILHSREEVNNEARCKLASMILNGARRLQKLFDRAGLLTSLRLGHAQLELIPVNLIELLQAQAAAATERHPEHNVMVRFENETALPALRVQADRRFLEVIAESLFDNAVQFSPDGGTIEVRAEALGGRARFSVTDHGPGISPAFLPYVFDSLHVEDTNHHGQGQGLSLALSKEMAEVMGGEIQVISAPGVATTFAVELPLAREGAETPAIHALQPPAD